jgi:hypothetical protein
MRWCTQGNTLRRDLSLAYLQLDELKFLEASRDGIRQAECEIISLHERFGVHASQCTACSPRFELSN